MIETLGWPHVPTHFLPTQSNQVPAQIPLHLSAAFQMTGHGPSQLAFLHNE